MMGTTTSVRIIELINPPITEIAIGDFVSLPSPSLSASGSMAKIIAKVVIKIGRSRFSPASRRASFTSLPFYYCEWRLTRLYPKLTADIPPIREYMRSIAYTHPYE